MLQIVMGGYTEISGCAFGFGGLIDLFRHFTEVIDITDLTIELAYKVNRACLPWHNSDFFDDPQFRKIAVFWMGFIFD